MPCRPPPPDGVFACVALSAFELPGAFGEDLEQDFNFWELLGNFLGTVLGQQSCPLMGNVVPLLPRPSAFELPGALGEHLEQDFNLRELWGNFWEPIFNFWDLLGNSGFRVSGFRVWGLGFWVWCTSAPKFQK